MSKSVAERLRMDHLQEATNAELRDAVSGTEKNPEADAAESTDPKTREEYTFSLNYKDGRGRLWEGSFTTKILDLEDRRKKAVLYATLAEGMSFDSIPPYDRILNEALAHLTFSLTKTPKWAEKPRKLRDPSLLLAIYEEVTSHEVTFLGRGAAAEGSEEKA
jgi:hypothetical protein